MVIWLVGWCRWYMPRPRAPRAPEGARTSRISRESPILTGASSQVLPGPHHPRCGFMARTVLIAAMAALALTACGQEICECIGNPPVPVTPIQRLDVNVTEQDHAVSMHVGQRLEVVLH